MMLGSVAYRGSLRRRSQVSTAGASSSSVSVPVSVSRSTVSLAPSAATPAAKVACGQPSSPASIGPVWALSPSIACLPRITRSTSSSFATAANSFATASGSSSWSIRASVFKWMPLSAPIAKAVRIVSWAFAGPIEHAMTSDATFFSFNRMASSTAFSQKGFIDIFTLFSSTPWRSDGARKVNLLRLPWVRRIFDGKMKDCEY
mmetsp:Transcript_15240/g.28579  ORF Transcript_15240/g.28579 Transcript_15240/m.28579 type:complete len:203 (-) Transcript_15240:199-807(-)